MSSPLEGRIRSIAREEASALLGVPGGVQLAAGSTPDAEQMQQQLTDLHEHLHHAATTISKLEQRVGALEASAGQANQEDRPSARRASRKTNGSTPTPE